MNPELKTKIVRQLKIEEGTVSLREDGIVHVHYHKNVVLDVPLQKRMQVMFAIPGLPQ